MPIIASATAPPKGVPACLLYLAQPRARYLDRMEAKPPMNFRKLRIAWSVVWGIFAVLLCVLWVRSYWQVIAVAGPIVGQHKLSIGMVPGSLVIATGPYVTLSTKWSITTWETEKWWAFVDAVWQSHPYYSKYLGVFSIGGGKLTVPCWFAVGVAAVVAAVPWILLTRFSVRTLLLLMTLIALVLVRIMWSAK